MHRKSRQKNSFDCRLRLMVAVRPVDGLEIARLDSTSFFGVGIGQTVEGREPSRAKWTIQGEPLGLIWQQKWLSDDQLLVGTGAGEYVCYGIFDFNQHQFYSLACSATPAATPEELSKATGNPEAWLTKKGLLADRGRWMLVDPRNFPWERD